MLLIIDFTDVFPVLSCSYWNKNTLKVDKLIFGSESNNIEDLKLEDGDTVKIYGHEFDYYK